MTKGCIKVDALIEWIEDKYFECKDDSVNHVVDEIIEIIQFSEEQIDRELEKITALEVPKEVTPIKIFIRTEV